MKIELLDHGYIEFIEAWGHGKEGKEIPGVGGHDDVDGDDNEVGIIEAARMSTNKGFEGWEKDQRLLKYLYSHKHMTPFEMAGMIIEVKAPIFIFREWHRHRTQSYNEMSGRYVPLPDENYIPSAARLMMSSGANKQAQSTGMTLTAANAELWREKLIEAYDHAQTIYTIGLAAGVPKELARLPVPVARYSRMRASTNLRNWLAFLTLRMAPDAQWEIQQYANAVYEIIKQQFPQTAELFGDQGV